MWRWLFRYLWWHFHRSAHPRCQGEVTPNSVCRLFVHSHQLSSKIKILYCFYPFIISISFPDISQGVKCWIE
jgi:hypothetical protein